MAMFTRFPTRRLDGLRAGGLAAAIMASAALATPAAAQIYIGPDGPVFVPGRPPPPYGRPPGWGQPGWGPSPGFGPISCGQGARIIASEGFRNIAPRDCSGRVYRYTAFRGRTGFEVRVSSGSGEITMVRRIR
jgi:hypothetical protein